VCGCGLFEDKPFHNDLNAAEHREPFRVYEVDEGVREALQDRWAQ
jgi:hypothetical protein